VAAEARLYRESIRSAEELHDTTGVELVQGRSSSKARPMVVIKQEKLDRAVNYERVSGGGRGAGPLALALAEALRQEPAPASVAGWQRAPGLPWAARWKRGCVSLAWAAGLGAAAAPRQGQRLRFRLSTRARR
jgi:hypothetical protein